MPHPSIAGYGRSFSGFFFSSGQIPEALRASPARRYYMMVSFVARRWQAMASERTLKNSVLVSTAAPTRGALMPLYMPINPSRCIDCLKQSSGPLYLRGIVSGCDCSRTLIVSNGYSMYFPTTPAADPHTTSFRASSPCPTVWPAAVFCVCSAMIESGSPPLPPTTDTGLSCSSINPRMCPACVEICTDYSRW
jgi:hypothetical protein